MLGLSKGHLSLALKGYDGIANKHDKNEKENLFSVQHVMAFASFSLAKWVHNLRPVTAKTFEEASLLVNYKGVG